ncbi:MULTISPECIES: hypothetical protein [Halorussus]|uniref:hypothetical protein n=1 Tax=Halorussus TaxID=1070314 RepID=UPI000E2196C2|nr:MULTISPECIES: hypothetical protein [Halorussus]NHN58403.1 hypothetical protein [Halorussus sp. JP-T4]
MASFRTRRGRCVLTDDELRIESGLASHVLRYWEGNRLLLAAYLAVYAALTVAAGRVLARGDWDALAFGVVAVAAAVVAGRRFSARRDVTRDSRIPLYDVEAVEAYAGEARFSPPRFVVRYWRGGDVKRRYVLMPSRTLSYADAEFEAATRLLRERGVPVEFVDDGGAVVRDW